MQLYLDYNSTCPPNTSILDNITKLYFTHFANSSGRSLFSQKSSKLIEEARSTVASIFNVQLKQIVFTSSASEANHIALWSLQNYFIFHKKNKIFRIAYSPFEHPSIIETIKRLPNTESFILKVNLNGDLDLDYLKHLIIEENIHCIAMMLVHNESGLILPIDTIINIIKEYPNIFLLCDSVQALYKLRENTSVENLSLNLFSAALHHNILFTFAGHKIGAGFGTGVLILPLNNNFNTIESLSPFGGGFQEFTWRPGSHNFYSIICFAEVLKEITSSANNYLQLKEITSTFEENLNLILSKYLSNNSLDNNFIIGKNNIRLAGTSFVILPNVSIDFLLIKLDQLGVVVSTGSSCKSNSRIPSKSLLAMGYTEDVALNTIRFSYDISFTVDKQKYVLDILENTIPKIMI